MQAGKSKSKPEGKPSGTSNLVQPLPYYQYLPEAELDQIKSVLCYVIKRYDPGLALTICRQAKDANVYFMVSEWNGTKVDIDSDHPLAGDAQALLATHGRSLAYLMSTIKVQQAQYYFGKYGTEYVLTDARISLHKMVGPGMLRDIFSKLMPTQETLKIEGLDERALEAIQNGTGNYAGPLVIKPSKFRVTTYHGEMVPLYVAVR